MFSTVLAFAFAALQLIMSAVAGIVDSYKTEVAFALAVGLALALAGSLFDRNLIVVALVFAFLEGRKIGENPLV
jgi:hypothetical protein